MLNKHNFPELEKEIIKYYKNRNFNSAYWGIVSLVWFVGWLFTGHVFWFAKYFEWIKL